MEVGKGVCGVCLYLWHTLKKCTVQISALFLYMVIAYLNSERK